MTKLKLNKIIVNCKTGEQLEREFTPEEYLQYEADLAAQSALNNEAEAKATAKAALLDRLGMTTEEAALLLS